MERSFVGGASAGAANDRTSEGVVTYKVVSAEQGTPDDFRAGDLSHFGISHSRMVPSLIGGFPQSDRLTEALRRSQQVKTHLKNTF